MSDVFAAFRIPGTQPAPHTCGDCGAAVTPPSGVDYRAAGWSLMCGFCASVRARVGQAEAQAQVPPRRRGVVFGRALMLAVLLALGLGACSPFIPDAPSSGCQSYYVGSTPATYHLQKVCKP